MSESRIQTKEAMPKQYTCCFLLHADEARFLWVNLCVTIVRFYIKYSIFLFSWSVFFKVRRLSQNKKVEQIIIADKENGQKLRHYWSAIRRSREWNKPLFMRKYAVCAFTPSPCIKRIWLQKPVKSKDFLTVIPFGKKGCRTERSGWLLFYSPWTSFTRRVMHLFHQMQPNTLQN